MGRGQHETAAFAVAVTRSFPEGGSSRGVAALGGSLPPAPGRGRVFILQYHAEVIHRPGVTAGGGPLVPVASRGRGLVCHPSAEGVHRPRVTARGGPLPPVDSVVASGATPALAGGAGAA